jgi:hypothetical protein
LEVRLLSLILVVEVPLERGVPGISKLFYTTRSPSILFEFFSNMLLKFEKKYWMEQCGKDAYLYLLF